MAGPSAAAPERRPAPRPPSGPPSGAAAPPPVRPGVLVLSTDQPFTGPTTARAAAPLPPPKPSPSRSPASLPLPPPPPPLPPPPAAERALRLDDSEVMIGGASIVAARPPGPDPGSRFQLTLEERSESPPLPPPPPTPPRVSVGGLAVEEGAAHVSVIQVDPEEEEEEDSGEDGGWLHPGGIFVLVVS